MMSNLIIFEKQNYEKINMMIERDYEKQSKINKQYISIENLINKSSKISEYKY